MIRKFAVALAEAFQHRRIPRNPHTEGAFERDFATPVATRIVRDYPTVSVFTHPWGNTGCCNPTCATASGTGRVVGCPKCWAGSKEWATVAAFGTKHTFDMVAKDHSKTLAVEIKLIDATRSKMPNGGIQRFLGQCALAAATHDVVIGLCGHRGTLNPELQCHTKAVDRWNKRHNVRLTFRQVT